ncbi:unnamed protein product [Phaedon cochleariae]|uniref:Ig-like domain-containing protein n=1 Tax=Phaedon cochleariae TaxID=80249 RepID=A0A9P0GUB9_PHACE|nr:unnamed protein product [Phaedon cochleariae]
MSGRIIHSNQSLVLQKVTRQSAGRYRCSVVNSEGETVSDELDFRVQYAPICKSDKIIVVGASRSESVDIACVIESDPPAKSYRWKFNNSGETIDVAAERFAKTSNGSTSVLRYTPVSELDYGSLSCWASNEVGHQVDPCVFQLVAAADLLHERCRIYWNFSFPTLRQIQANKPDIVLLDHHSKAMFVIEFSAPAEPNIVLKEGEKRTKYRDLLFELRRLYPDHSVELVILIIGSLGSTRHTLLSEIQKTPACRDKAHILTGGMQKAVILGSLRSLRAHGS